LKLSINIRKAPGPDGEAVPNWLLRDFAAILCEPLCAIFNQSLREGHFPSSWKQANVLPIPKTQPPTSIDNDLRPISLTPTISKIFEALVGRHIISAMHGKFDQQQFGAIRGRSTVHALIDVTHTWLKALDGGNSVRAVFIDYRKAFDHVQHSIVLRKMAAFGVEPVLINWLHSFLTDRRQRVKVGKSYSKWVSLPGSLPQGTWLGPLLFLGLINDLKSFVHIDKFVDDVTLSEIVPKGSNISCMQVACSEVEQWSTANCMNINPKKTKEIIFGPLSKLEPDSLSLNVGGQNLQPVKVFKLLGLHINQTLKWDDHILQVSSKINKRLYFLKHLKKAGMSNDDLVNYYRSVIRPVAEYACQVWHCGLTKKQAEQLERLQHRAIKIIFGDSLDYKSATLIYDLDTLAARREKLTSRLFKEITQNSEHSIHHLLPAKNCKESLSRLRKKSLYPVPFCKTAKFKNSFFPYCLKKFQ
jgi:hypothetical protein